MDLLNTELTFHPQTENPFGINNYQDGWTYEALWDGAMELVETSFDQTKNRLYLNKTVCSDGQTFFTLFTLTEGKYQEIYRVIFLGDEEGWEDMVVSEVEKYYQTTLACCG